MYSTRQIFLYFLILNTLQVFQNDFVSARSTLSENLTRYDVENDYISKAIAAKKPSDNYLYSVQSIISKTFHSRLILAPFWVTKFIRTAITITIALCESVPKPMTLFTALDEPCLVNRTDNLLQHTLTVPVTVYTMTATAFDSKLFECYSYSLAWDTHTRNPWNMEAQIVYKNADYTSIEGALKNRNGVIVMNIPIGTSGNVSNLQFDQYGTFLKTKLKEPGSWATTQSADTYLWYNYLPNNGIYTTFQREYTDPISGQSGNATAAVISFYPELISISKNQFTVFSDMGDKSGQMSQNLKRLSPEKQHKGIITINLPA